MAFIYNLSDTWNNVGTVFNAIKMDVTDTASSANSRLLTLQVGGVERLGVDKLGNLTVTRTSSSLGAVGTPSYTFTGDTNTGMWSPAADTLAFSTAGSERVRVDSSGNVGIGTTSFTDRLAVNGSVAVEAGSELKLLNSANSGFGSIVSAGGGSLSLRSYGNEMIQLNEDANILFKTSGGTERMRLDASGNVGIGTSSPARQVTINSSFPILQFTNPTTGTGASDGLLIFQSGLNSTFSNQESGALIFETANTERMRIDSSGNVGIGTSSPGARLDVKGLVRSSIGTGTGAGGAGYAFYQFGTSATASENWHIGAEGDGSFRFYNQGFGAGLERMRIDSSGNVGIGTSSPGARLDVISAAGSGAVAGFTNTSNGSSLGGVVSSINAGGNNTNSWHYIGVTQTVAVWYLYGNGTTSYTSDIRVKKNVETTRDGYLDDVSRLRVVKYNWYNDSDDTPRELGFIAQEVEQVFPGLVQDAAHPTKDGICHKVLKASVLLPILTKALQEANAKIDALAARVAQLEGN